MKYLAKKTGLSLRYYSNHLKVLVYGENKAWFFRSAVD